jgi:hypothetical protein
MGPHLLRISLVIDYVMSSNPSAGQSFLKIRPRGVRLEMDGQPTTSSNGATTATINTHTTLSPQQANSLPDLPAVKPSAIALGTLFNHTVELAVLSPVFGQTYHRAKSANTKEEFIRSREATGAAVAWGTALVGSGLQAYGVGALINATGTLSYKGAAYLGALIFAATSAPTVRPPSPPRPSPPFSECSAMVSLLTAITVLQRVVRREARVGDGGR